MKTLAILSRKGGTGKTTIAVHLSVAAEQAGHTTALIDLDPQASTIGRRSFLSSIACQSNHLRYFNRRSFLTILLTAANRLISTLTVSCTINLPITTMDYLPI